MTKLHLPIFILLSIATCVFFLNCRDTSTNPPLQPEQSRRQLTSNEQALIGSTNTFGLKLFRTINELENKPNIFISPLSVSLALGMTLNGAAGATYDSMQKTLEHDGLTNQEINQSYQSLTTLLTNLDPKVLFTIANSIWYRYTFEVEAEFIQTNKIYFDAEVTPLDFGTPEATDIINAWVNEKTREKIKEIIKPPINPLTVMFLINAIYFKGTWTYQFDSTKTKDGEFTCTDGTKKTVRMMNQTNNFLYYEDNTMQAIDLPYGNGDFRMTVLLPKPSIPIDAFIAGLDIQTMKEIINRLDSAQVVFSMPRFKLEYDLLMNDVLKTMGMAVAFSVTADFTRINRNGGLHISQVRHKSFVEVNEEGTEAAAVTIVEIGIVSIGGGPSVMTVNRPFVFVIRDAPSSTVLFIGKIGNPS
jgi:serine protease inhibitor